MNCLRFLGRLGICLLVAALLVQAGCKGKSFSIDRAIKSAFGKEDTTPQEQAAMVFDTKDPDKRREGIELLSNKSWALREPYLKRFAQLTQPAEEKDPSVRAVAVRTLGRAKAKKYMPEILAALEDPSPVVRWDAATVMCTMPNDKAIVDLQRMAINDESVDVRSTSARALRHYRTNSVYRTLLRCLDDDEFSVRYAAHDSLVAQTGQDCGFDPEAWAGDPKKLGKETLPPTQVRYKKRPWWDWMKVTKESETVPAEKK